MSLPEPVRRRLSSFSRTVFTDNNRTRPDTRSGCGSDIPDNEIVSSLSLQMSLYFNLCFFPFWWVSSIVMLQLKYPVLADYYKFILVTIIILTTMIEAIRLYLGYMGNLQEKTRPHGSTGIAHCNTWLGLHYIQCGWSTPTVSGVLHIYTNVWAIEALKWTLWPLVSDLRFLN